MAHLRKRPTVFVKGDQRRYVYFTVQARELRAAGFVEEGSETNAAEPTKKPEKKLPEIPVRAGYEAFEVETPEVEVAETEEAKESPDFLSMTKAELLDWALEKGHDLKNALPKSDILAQCVEIENSL